MTDSNITYPGSYRIKSLMLYPFPSSEPRIAVDMRNLVPSLTINESMVEDSIRGSLSVVDSSGLLEGYPIRGEEMLYIDLEDALGNSRQYRLFVYKVDNVDIAGINDRLSYTLHFVSFQRFIADQARVISSYNRSVSDIVEAIFNARYRAPVTSRPVALTGESAGSDPNKQIVVEDTDGNVRLIIPRMTPTQAIKFLESRAYSSSSATCSFRFFESADSFYFVTDEFLYNKAKNDDKIFEFSYTDSLPHDNSFFLHKMANFTRFKNVARVDTFDDLHGGTYRNKVIVLDIVNRVVNTVDPSFDYMNARDSYFSGHAEELDGADRHSTSFIRSTFTDENARQFLMVRDYAEEDAGQLRGEQYLPEITSNRLSYFKNLSSIRVSASGPGRVDITCGDFVDVNIPEFKHLQAEKQTNVQLAGVYMVESVMRVVDKDIYNNEYTLVKRSWDREVDPTENRFLLGGVT